MPSRTIRDGLLTSPKFNSLRWIEQNFFMRLLLVVDDYACFEAHPDVLRVALFPTALDKLSTADVKSCLNACQAAGLVSVYTAKKHSYLFIPNFRNRCRSRSRRYPPPDEDARLPLFAENDAGQHDGQHDRQHDGHHDGHHDSNPPNPSPSAVSPAVSPSVCHDLVCNNYNNKFNNKNEVVVDNSTAYPDAAGVTSTTTTTSEKAFSSWLTAVCAVRPLLARLRTLPPAVLAAAKLAYVSCPQAALENIPALRRYYAADDALVPYPPYYRPTSYEKMFRELPDIIEHARMWCERDDARQASAARKEAAAAARKKAAEKEAAAVPDPKVLDSFRDTFREILNS